MFLRLSVAAAPYFDEKPVRFCKFQTNILKILCVFDENADAQLKKTAHASAKMQVSIKKFSLQANFEGDIHVDWKNAAYFGRAQPSTVGPKIGRKLISLLFAFPCVRSCSLENPQSRACGKK